MTLFTREDIFAIRARFDDGEHPRSIRRDYPRASIITIARIGKRETFAEIGAADERKLIASRLRRETAADTAADSLAGLRRRLVLEGNGAPPGGPKTSSVSPPETADAEIARLADLAFASKATAPAAEDLLADMLASHAHHQRNRP